MARKPADVGSTVHARAVTDVLRRQVREELPEIAQISDAALQEKAKRGDQTSTAAMRSRSTRSIRAGSV